MKIPDQAPEKGFYYHFKHDPTKGVNNYVYEMLGMARHSEDESYLVIYQPLYTSEYHRAADFSARPIDLFIGEVTRDGKTFPRFQRITDPAVIAQLEEIKKQMYS